MQYSPRFTNYEKTRIRDLAAKGKKAPEIARALRTRDAASVYGWCIRNGINLKGSAKTTIPRKEKPNLESVQATDILRQSSQEARRSASKAILACRVVGPLGTGSRKPVATAGVLLIDLKPDCCVWQLGDGIDMLACGAPRVAGAPYCVEHTRLATPAHKRLAELEGA